MRRDKLLRPTDAGTLDINVEYGQYELQRDHVSAVAKKNE